MYCTKCGAWSADSAAFCGRCGQRLQTAAVQPGKQPAAQKKPAAQQKLAAQKKPKKAKTSVRSKVMIALAICIAVLVMVGTGVFLYWRFTPRTEAPPRSTEKRPDPTPIPDTFELKAPDADAFYAENSEVLEVINVSDSQNVLTEAEATARFRAAGFTDFPVYANCSMDDVYLETREVSESSSELHPSYETYFVTERGEMWIIMLIESDMLANPLFFNAGASPDAQVIVSESETVTSYDMVTNRFFKTVPKDSAMLLRVVEEINADVLNDMTEEALMQP